MIQKRRTFLAFISVASIGIFFRNIPAAVSKAVLSCIPTTPDVLGPFYKSKSPLRILIAALSEPGTRLKVEGKIYASDCATPLGEALIEVWHASAKGIYDNSSAFNLRGQVLSAADGSYEFETVYPGSYDRRPSHIHFRISAMGYSTLVTQLYFEGDPLIAIDPFASKPSAEQRIVAVNKLATIWKANFDINLASVTGIEEQTETNGYLAIAGENPFAETTQIAFSNYQKADILVCIYDPQGKKIRTLFQEIQHSPNRQTLTWDAKDDNGNSLPAGIYVATLYQNQAITGRVKIVKK